MIILILNYFHRSGFRRLLNVISKIAYFLKGFGYVKASYHPSFRGYSYQVRGVTYLSLGPGWAYNFEYLRNALVESYNHEYLPKLGDCVVDIGAGLGEETAIYSMLAGRSGKVHALEANPVTYSGLHYLCKQNGFIQTIPHHLAIYNTDGEVTIEDNEESYLTNTINATTSKTHRQKVRALTLDSFVKENSISCIDFLKSNIEGAEQFLIEGMSDSIKIIRNVCISCHDFRHIYHGHGELYVTKEKVKSFLLANGFEIIDRHSGNRVIDDFIYARNPLFTEFG